MKLLRTGRGQVHRCHFVKKMVRLPTYSKQEKIIIILSQCQEDLKSSKELAIATGHFAKSDGVKDLLRELLLKGYIDRFQNRKDQPYYYLALPAGIEYLKQISGEDQAGQLPGFAIKKPGRCSCGKFRKMEIPLCKRCWGKISEADQKLLQDQLAHSQDLKNSLVNSFKQKFSSINQNNLRTDQLNP